MPPGARMRSANEGHANCVARRLTMPHTFPSEVPSALWTDSRRYISSWTTSTIAALMAASTPWKPSATHGRIARRRRPSPVSAAISSASPSPGARRRSSTSPTARGSAAPEKWRITLQNVAIALTLAVALTGCATGGMPKTWVGKNPQGQEILTQACIPHQSASDCLAMPTVTFTTNPADEEYWLFTARAESRENIVIPDGRWPLDLAVIGPRESCDAIRANLEKIDTPTQPCRGPLYFRRDKT